MDAKIMAEEVRTAGKTTEKMTERKKCSTYFVSRQDFSVCKKNCKINKK